MSNKKYVYLISTVSVSYRMTSLHETSFEKVTTENYKKFCEMKEPSLLIYPGKHQDFDVYLNEEWTIKQIKDKAMINAINKLWSYLPHNNHIADATPRSDEEY
jgi:hypothetical protein